MYIYIIIIICTHIRVHININIMYIYIYIQHIVTYALTFYPSRYPMIFPTVVALIPFKVGCLTFSQVRLNFLGHSHVFFLMVNILWPGASILIVPTIVSQAIDQPGLGH